MEPQVVHDAEILNFVIVLLLINSVFSVDGEKGLLVFNDDMFVPSSFWGVVVDIFDLIINNYDSP